MISWKVCINWGYEIRHKISVPNCQKLKRSETSITKLWRQAWKNWIRNSGQGSKRTNLRWRRKRYLLSVERKRPVFERRTVQFPSRDPRMCAKNQNTLPPHFLSHPCHEVEVSRKRSIRGKSNHGSVHRQPCGFFLRGFCTWTPCEYLHPPECQSFKDETGCKAGNMSVSALQGWWTTKWTAEEEQLHKRRRERRQDCCCYGVKYIAIGFCITRFRCTRFSR